MRNTNGNQVAGKIKKYTINTSESYFQVIKEAPLAKSVFSNGMRISLDCLWLISLYTAIKTQSAPSLNNCEDFVGVRTLTVLIKYDDQPYYIRRIKNDLYMSRDNYSNLQINRVMRPDECKILPHVKRYNNLNSIFEDRSWNKKRFVDGTLIKVIKTVKVYQEDLTAEYSYPNSWEASSGVSL